MNLDQLRRGEACASDLALDLSLTGELAPAEAADLRDHLRRCSACSARHAAMERIRAEPLPELELPARAPRASRRPWWQIATPIFALAAAAVVLVFIRRAPTDDATRLKGGVSIRLFIGHGERIRLAGEREQVAPGDVVQVAYTASAPIFLAVLSRDGAGTVSVYFPERGREAWRGAPGADVTLPASTVLDDVHGREALHVVICPQAFELAALVRALEEDRVSAPPACQLESFTLEKVGP